MKAAWYERNGPAREVLRTGEMPDPEPGPGEVRVRVASSGVNPSDWKTRSGSRPMAGPRVIPHSDGAGTIDRVGTDVPASRVGERVWVWNGQWKRPFGTAAEFIVVPAAQAVALPANTSFDEGACFGIPALTAYRAVTIGGPIAGHDVLVAGGAGAVGHYAIQFAKLLGARRVIATVSSDEKGAHAKAAGADVVVNYRTEPVVERVREATDGRGVDRVVEVDAAKNAALLPQVLVRDGICAIYGSSVPQVAFEFGPMIGIGAQVHFFIVYELAPDVRAEAERRLTGWLEQGVVRHAIAKRYPLAEIATAHEVVEKGEVMGNVIVAP